LSKQFGKDKKKKISHGNFEFDVSDFFSVQQKVDDFSTDTIAQVNSAKEKKGMLLEIARANCCHILSEHCKILLENLNHRRSQVTEFQKELCEAGDILPVKFDEFGGIRKKMADELESVKNMLKLHINSTSSS